MGDLKRVLIVDDSRLVRMALARNLKEHFDVVEEGDGESAWQRLVLDNTIQVVISDLQMPKLDGFGLLQKVRGSTLRRLQELPFIVVSGEETEEERERARHLGVSDFVTKGAGSAEILTRVNNLLLLSAAREGLEAGRESMVRDPASGLFSRTYLEHQATQAFAHATRSGVELCIMVLGFDAFDQVSVKLGSDVAEKVVERFAKMLAGKIRQEDSLGHYAIGQYAIIAPGTSPVHFTGFAERVREAVEVARMPVRGEPVSLTVSIGVACAPPESVASANELLALAGERMEQAMRAGGNRIYAGDGDPAAARHLKLQRAIELLAAGRPDIVRPHLRNLGKELLPLFAQMNKDLGLSLPLAELERHFSDRADH